ncbi:MAG: DUF6686 family protein [Bacteroidota bacterium]
MCKYEVLAENNGALIQLCKGCGSYTLQFNNLVMNFPPLAFHQFKKSVQDCYNVNVESCGDRDKRTIIFNTRLDSMQLLFSTNEVGALLALLQEAQIQELMLVESDGFSDV